MRRLVPPPALVLGWLMLLHPGGVPAQTPGATTSHVTITLAGGAKVVAPISNEAMAELAIAPGDSGFAVVKASDVMVGKA